MNVGKPGRDELAPHARHALPASLTRALSWLNGRLDGPIQLDTLAAVAGVRPRTLELHFKLYLGTTPLGWVRRTRLARTRQQLVAAGDDASITAIAAANGFSELGRFAAHYRRQFGELPSETLKAARGSPLNGADAIDDDEVVAGVGVHGRSIILRRGAGRRRAGAGAGAGLRAAEGDRRVVLEPTRGA